MFGNIDAVAKPHAGVSCRRLEARYVAREGGPRGLHALEARSPAGVAQAAPRPGVALEHDDLIVRPDEGGVGQARRAGADDGDALATRLRALGKRGLTASFRVDEAVERPTAAHAADAGIAGEAAAHGYTGLDLARPRGVGEQGTSKRNEVAGTGAQRGLSGPRISQPADGDHGQTH